MNNMSRDQHPTGRQDEHSWQPPPPRPEYQGPLAPLPPSSSGTGPGGLTAKSIAAKFSITAGLLFGGLALAVISLFLPWTTVSLQGPFGGTAEKIDASPFNGGWIFVIFMVIAVAAWLAWPTLSGTQMFMKRLAGLTGAVSLLAGCLLIGFANFVNAFMEKQKLAGDEANLFASLAGSVHVSLGFGLVLYAVAVAAVGLGLGRIWIQRLTANKRAP